MTDRTGLRSISTFRPMIGHHPQQRLPRSSAVAVRLSRRRNERFRASVSGHSGLGAHVRRHARLGGFSRHRNHAGDSHIFSGLPLILRRFVRRTRRQAENKGPAWPTTRPRPYLRRASDAGESEILPYNDPAYTGESEPGFADDLDDSQPLIEEIFGDESRQAGVTTHPAMATVVRRHTNFIGRDALPPTLSIGTPLPFGAPLRQADARPRDSVSGAFPSMDALRLTIHRRRGHGVEQRARRSPIPIMDAALSAELMRPEFLATDYSEGSAPLPVSRPVRRGGLATTRVISSLGPPAQRSISHPFPGHQPARQSDEPSDLSSWSQPGEMLRRRPGMIGGTGSTRSHDQTSQDIVPVSAAFPIALNAIERGAALLLPLRLPGMIWRDTSASSVGLATVSPAISDTGSRAFGTQPLRRRQHAIASAALAADVMSDVEESPSQPLDTLPHWAPFRAIHSPLRPHFRDPRSPRRDTAAASSSAMIGRFVEPAASPRTRSWAELATTETDFQSNPGVQFVARRVRRAGVRQGSQLLAASELSWDVQASNTNQSGVNRADRVLAMRRRAPRPVDAPLGSAIPQSDVAWERALRPAVNRPLAQRLAAHDEPFAPATRLMRAAAVAHVLRRLPPTIGAPTLAEQLAERRQPSWPHREADQRTAPEPDQTTLFRGVIQSLSLPSAPSAPSASVSEPTGRSRMAAPLRLQRMPSVLSQGSEQSTAGRTSAIAVPAASSDEGIQRRLAQLPRTLHSRPDVVARKLAELLGASSPTAQVAAKSAIHRVQPVNAIFAPAVSSSTLPAPVSHHRLSQAGVASSVPEESPLWRWTRADHPENRALTPFVARQIARVTNDLRLVSPITMPLPVGRMPSPAGHSGASPAGPARSRTLQRSGDGHWPSGAGPRGDAVLPVGVVRPPWVSPVAQAVLNEDDTRDVSSPIRRWPLAGLEEIDPISRVEDSPPFTQGFSGFPFTLAGAERRQANPLSARNQPLMTKARPSKGASSPERREHIRRSAIQSIFRQAPTGPSFGLLGQMTEKGEAAAFVGFSPIDALSAPASFARPWFARRSITPRAPSARESSGTVTRPLVFRSALPSAGEPSLAQRTAAAEAMAQSSGQPLPPLVRRSMEHLFRMDLATVRVHGGPQAARATDLVAARAMASGADVFLPGGISDSPRGPDLPLLAHELTHVAHHFGQRPPSSPAAAPLTLAHRTASTEQDAERVERMVADSIQRQPAAASTPPSLTLARKPAPVTIMRVDEPSPASSPSPTTTSGSATAEPTAADASNPSSKQDQQKLADQIFHMLEQRLIIARERGGHRL